MKSIILFDQNKRQKAKIYKKYKPKKKKNNNSILNFLLIIYNYIIFLGLLTQICSQPREQFDHYKKPYISAIYIGTGIKTLVNPSSTITPHRAFMTSTSTELTISLEDTVLINSDDNENNITMEFSFTNFEMEDLFEDISYIKKVDLSNFNIKPSSIKNMFSGCRKLEEIIFGDFDT